MKKWSKYLLLVSIFVIGSGFAYAALSPKKHSEDQYMNYSMHSLSTAPRVSTITDFLSDEECDHLMKLAQPQLARSTVTDESGASNGVIDNRRSSKGVFLDKNGNDPIMQRIENRIAAMTGMPVENGEQIQVLQYGVGGEYQPHYDYFTANTPGGKASLDRGGQRLISLIMYLNTPEAGGETIFPKAKLSVTPKRGSAVLFYNCNPAGNDDPMTLHGGAPVKAGEKWIATKWIRKGEFH